MRGTEAKTLCLEGKLLGRGAGLAKTWDFLLVKTEASARIPWQGCVLRRASQEGSGQSQGSEGPAVLSGQGRSKKRTGQPHCPSPLTDPPQEGWKPKARSPRPGSGLPLTLDPRRQPRSGSPWKAGAERAHVGPSQNSAPRHPRGCSSGSP